MANQYTLNNDFSAIVETQGTLYNPSSSNIELASAADTVKGKGIIFPSGATQTFRGTLYARSMDASATLNVSDFTEAAGGGGGGSYVLPIASASVLGGIKVGSNLSIDSNGVLSASGGGGYVLPEATASTLGGVIIGDNVGVEADGTISVPVGTTSVKGVLQVGTGLAVADGVVSANIGDATTSAKGLVQIGDNIDVSNGEISVPKATTSSLGVVSIGSGFSVDSAGEVTVDAIADATTSTKGVVQVGDNIDVSSGVISVPLATASTPGVVSVGAGLSVDSSGVLSAAGYTLPTASATVLGGVKVGSNLSIDGSGVLSADAAPYTLPTATASVLGGVTIGDNIDVSSGVISVPKATSSTLGVVKPGTGLSVDSNGVMSADTIADATTTSKGIVQIGDNIDVSSGVISVPKATSLSLGVVKVGTNLYVDSDGTISAADAAVGILPQIVVTAPAGCTVTVSKGATTLTATEVSGTWTFDDVPKLGVWTVNCTLHATTRTATVNVTEIKTYNVSIKPYYVMTVNIDLTDSNPATCCSYADDAVSMTAGSADWDTFFGEYPVMLSAGVEGAKLNPADYSKHIDGTAADITSGAEGDVMVAFPRRGLKISTSGNTLTISMTDDPDAAGFNYFAHQRGSTDKNVFYLGAYLGCVSSSKLRSLSGVTPTVSTSISAFRTLAQANGAPDGSGGSGYEQRGFYQTTYLQAMYVLKYANLNCQSAVGMGYTKGTNSGVTATGGANSRGMDYGESTGTQQCKLFGIEDAWGNLEQMVDGVYVSGTDLLTATDNYNDSSTGYSIAASGIALPATGFMNAVIGTTAAGFVSAANGGSDATYFCDQSTVLSNQYMECSGRYDGSTKAGIFRGRFVLGASEANEWDGARLMYL